LLGVDIGGTFTDFALLETGTGTLATGKCLTTPDDPSRGFLEGLRELCARTGLKCEALERLSHATTLVTNAIIERKGCRTGLILTAGFGDGHNAAARNVREALERSSEKVEVTVADRYERSYKRLNGVAKKAYLGAVRYAPKLWAGFFKLMDRSPWLADGRGLARLQQTLAQLLEETQPDWSTATTAPGNSTSRHSRRDAGKFWRWAEPASRRRTAIWRCCNCFGAQKTRRGALLCRLMLRRARCSPSENWPRS